MSLTKSEKINAGIAQTSEGNEKKRENTILANETDTRTLRGCCTATTYTVYKKLSAYYA